MSMQLASRARAAGWVVSPRQIFEEKTPERLARVAVAVDAVSVEVADSGVGKVPWTPVMREMGADALRSQFAQWVVVGVPADLGTDVLRAAVQALVDTHGMLRARAVTADDAGDPVLIVPEPGEVDTTRWFVRVDAADVPEDRMDEHAARAAREAVERLRPVDGVMAQVVWLDAGAERMGRVVLVVHHLVVDGVSWRVLVPDLRAACEAVAAGREPAPEATGTSFRTWARQLQRDAESDERAAELDSWMNLLSGAGETPLGRRALDPSVDTVATLRRRAWQVSAAQAAALAGCTPALFHCGVHEVLLATLTGAVAGWRPEAVVAGGLLVEVEGHGRESLVEGMDLSRTVGWFTAAYPVRLDASGVDLADAVSGGAGAGDLVKRIKEQVQAVPGDGLGYGLLRYVNPETAEVLAGLPSAQVGFNYLGRFTSAGDATDGAATVWELAGEQAVGGAADPEMPALHALDAGAVIADTPQGPELTLSLSWPAGLFDDSEVDRLGCAWLELLSGLAAHTADPGAGGHTPSDFPLVALDQVGVEELESLVPGLVDVWPLSPLQEGMFFHASLGEGGRDAYVGQRTLELTGPVDAARLRRTWQALLERHPILRAGFRQGARGEAVQVVVDGVVLPWREVDVSGLGGGVDGDGGAVVAAERVAGEELACGFDVGVPPLVRVA
ncbi:condensation domain-containing protein, partial [Streptomyces sp. NPDC058457]|uniref:condensation domain-containing protein n=1 Tax=Streptomyces sp. NPDC058457 TaxID=3346507 RepID=UPI0036609526